MRNGCVRRKRRPTSALRSCSGQLIPRHARRLTRAISTFLKDVRNTAGRYWNDRGERSRRIDADCFCAFPLCGSASGGAVGLGSRGA